MYNLNKNLEKKPLRLVLGGVFALALSLLLSGCLKEKTMGISYGAVNHTDKHIVSIIINGEGGILNSRARNAGGASVCCVVLPAKWRPGLMATIKWQEDGDWLRDEKGNVVLKDGRKTYVPLPYKTQTVEVPEYKEEGYFYVFFFPNDVVKVAVTVAADRKLSHF